MISDHFTANCQKVYTSNGSKAEQGQWGKTHPRRRVCVSPPRLAFGCPHFWVPRFSPLVDRGARKFTPPGPSCDGDRDGVMSTQN